MPLDNPWLKDYAMDDPPCQYGIPQGDHFDGLNLTPCRPDCTLGFKTLVVPYVDADYLEAAHSAFDRITPDVLDALWRSA